MRKIKKIHLFAPVAIGLFCLGTVQPFAQAQDNNTITITAENKAKATVYGLFENKQDAYSGDLKKITG